MKEENNTFLEGILGRGRGERTQISFEERYSVV
jgi:hypothetical protein